MCRSLPESESDFQSDRSPVPKNVGGKLGLNDFVGPLQPLRKKIMCRFAKPHSLMNFKYVNHMDRTELSKTVPTDGDAKIALHRIGFCFLLSHSLFLCTISVPVLVSQKSEVDFVSVLSSTVYRIFTFLCRYGMHIDFSAMTACHPHCLCYRRGD